MIVGNITKPFATQMSNTSSSPRDANRQNISILVHENEWRTSRSAPLAAGWCPRWRLGQKQLCEVRSLAGSFTAAERLTPHFIYYCTRAGFKKKKSFPTSRPPPRAPRKEKNRQLWWWKSLADVRGQRSRLKGLHSLGENAVFLGAGSAAAERGGTCMWKEWRRKCTCAPLPPWPQRRVLNVNAWKLGKKAPQSPTAAPSQPSDLPLHLHLLKY